MKPWLPTHRHILTLVHIRLIQRIDGVCYCDYHGGGEVAISAREFARDYEAVESEQSEPYLVLRVNGVTVFTRPKP